MKEDQNREKDEVFGFEVCFWRAVLKGVLRKYFFGKLSEQRLENA